MGRYETRIAGQGIDEKHSDDTERMAVNRFAELLAYDTAEGTPRYPAGVVIECQNVEAEKVLIRYVVGYE